MPIYSFLVGSYAREIYLYGNRTFANINQAYVEPVKLYAATGYFNGQPTVNFTGFSVPEIDNALAKGWITQQEYDDTIALKG